jgi:hypothetical protein
MLILMSGVMLTAALFVRLEFVRRSGAADLGTMSPHWIAACQASRQSPS